jgi:glycosyltransferase involved in cell wall biosynthesis
MHDPAISVIMPAYDREASIRGAVESVLRQTWTDFELIVVDDGSTDGTVAALKAIEDPRLRVIAEGVNCGVSAARNLGIAAARAPWIAFQDSDDEWLPEKLALQMARIEALGAGCIGAYCGMAVIGTPDETKDGAKGGRTSLRYLPAPYVTAPEGDLRRPLAHVNLISTQTLIARRQDLEAIGGFDEALTALVDWDLVLRLAPRGRFAFVDRPLVHQYFSANSITRSQRKRTLNHARILEKNHALFEPFPDHLAYNYRALSGNYRLMGDNAQALRWMARAIRAEPGRARNYAVAALLWSRRLRGRSSGAASGAA